MAVTLSSWQPISLFAPKRRVSQSKLMPRSVASLNEKNVPAPATGYAVSETSVATAKLDAEDRAAFAVTSRLLASLVTEALLQAFYVPIRSELCVGICIILSSTAPPGSEGKSATNIFAVVPLHHAPIMKEGVDGSVWLLDPLDMLPNICFFGDEMGELCEVRRYPLQTFDTPDSLSAGASTG